MSCSALFSYHKILVSGQVEGGSRKRGEMATPIFRALVPRSHPTIHLPSLATPSLFRVSNRRRLLYCASSELSPVRPELVVSLCVGTHIIPHPRKALSGGEDAYFVSNYHGGVIAVADGVSGWAEEDVDPSLFPRELMANASSFLTDEEVDYDPQTILKKAHAATSSIGSATVIVAMLGRDGVLKIANVGDCGLRIIRNGQITFSTYPQEHYFDCPYQLSSEKIGQTYLDAKVSRVEVLEGDIIVMGSDGLFDNVYNHELVSTIAGQDDVAEAAKALADLASNHSKDTNFESPYSLEALSKGYDVPWWKKMMGMKLTGGKLDDITVVVGQVVSSRDVFLYP